MASSAAVWLTVLPILIMLVLGGSNAQSVLLRTIGIWTGLALLGVAIYQIEWRRFYREDRLFSWLMIGVVLLFVMQLMPLPAASWTDLPGREVFAYGDRLMLGVNPSRPISLDPDATLANAVFLFTPLGIYTFLRARGDTRLELFFVVFLAFAALSLLLGLVQAMAGGWPEIYPGGNRATPSGLFANRNHQAIMLACAIPIGAAFISRYRLGARLALRSGISTRVATAIVLAALFGACAVGALLTGSRTGSVLLIPAMIAALAIGGYFRTGSARALLIGLAVIIAAVAALFILTKAGGALGLVFTRGVSGEEDRFSYWPAAIEVAKIYFPFGSGIGTFNRIYEMHEPVTLLAPLRLYNAHNDWLELVIETGLFGPLLAVLFLIWFARRGWSAWQTPDAVMPKAASVVILLLLLHSIVDYPLRMTALAVLFAAAACALAGTGRTASMLRNRKDKE